MPPPRRRDRGAIRSAKRAAWHRDNWTRCIVPGCEFTVPKLLDITHGIAIALCTPHQVAVWEHVNESLNEPSIYESRQAMQARRDAILAAENDVRQSEAEMARQVRSERARNLDIIGALYYVRVGDLIKVGWTSDLWSRMRAYGPNAELLVHYPGSRRDEAALHRNLTPSRAKGREWYHDDAIIRAFVATAIRQHGPPKVTEFGWTQPKQIVAGKRAKRSA